jgi:hypothetical protein
MAGNKIAAFFPFGAAVRNETPSRTPEALPLGGSGEAGEGPAPLLPRASQEDRWLAGVAGFRLQGQRLLN